MIENELGIMIGLEIHVQLTHLKTKLFCGCSTNYRGKKPNTNLCPTCMGLPGDLPVINEQAVKDAVALSFALNAQVQQKMLFFRKKNTSQICPKTSKLLNMIKQAVSHSQSKAESQWLG